VRRALRGAKTWLIYQLDHFVAWTPWVQTLVIILASIVLVLAWAFVLRLSGQTVAENPTWWTLTRLMDGGTMAADRGFGLRLVAIGVTTSGVLLLSLTTGAFASKLSERLNDLKQGKSPVAERAHVLVLGFDSKVPLIAQELARSHQRITFVTLSKEDKARQDAHLRAAKRVPRSRLKIITRTGDPRSEVTLLRVAADRASSIVLVTPRELDDEAAMRWTLSVLLALRRVTAPSFRGRVIVEVRRQSQCPLLALVGEAGLAGDDNLRLELIASDDLVARILAQSVRHGAVYLAIRELLSFAGSELYLEPVPKELVGKSFEAAHAQVTDAVCAGIRTAEGGILFAPTGKDAERRIGERDRLIVLEENLGELTLGGTLPAPPPVGEIQIEAFEVPQNVAVLGANRSLSCLIFELDRIMPSGSTVRISAPELADEVSAAAKACRRVAIDQRISTSRDVGKSSDPAMIEADGVVILGCEDELDPDGDASAVSLLLQLRHERRSGARPGIRRLITEVRDPAVAHQIASSLDDFLVSADVIAMMLAHAAFDPDLASVYGELLAPRGAEIFVRPRRYYLPDGPATFADLMSAARRRGDVALGFFPDARLNPPRNAPIPSGDTIGVIALSRGT
jgi:hypothetical protein